jgi:hypothetical protein
MERAYDRYLQGIHAQFNYFAAWLPTERRSLGEIGVLKDGVFQRVTSLENEGFTFKSIDDPSPADFEHSSGISYAIAARAGAEIANAAKGEASIDFSGSGAFAFVAKDCAVRTIDDKYLLGQELALAFKKGTWLADWVLIDTIVTARCATILVAGSQKASLTLSANAPLNAGLPGLADARAGLGVSSASGEITKVLAGHEVTPMFRLSRVNRRYVIGPPRLDPMRTGSDGSVDSEDNPLEQVRGPWGESGGDGTT